MSGPISWPFMTRPVWYLHEDVEGIRRAVLLIGNPVVMWAGLAATLFLFRSATLVKDPRMLIVPSLFLFALGMAVIFPGSISFYYHYYIAALFLPMGLATALETHFRRGRRRFVPLAALALTVATFVYFYPIISAAALPGPTAFEKWMWLSSWR
jgi:dolichyl-phosphate-mannose--protein O-mannosyl transferase